MCVPLTDGNGFKPRSFAIKFLIRVGSFRRDNDRSRWVTQHQLLDANMRSIALLPPGSVTLHVYFVISTDHAHCSGDRPLKKRPSLTRNIYDIIQ